MKIEVTHYVVLDDDERKFVKETCQRCHPACLSEDQKQVRNRLSEERKYELRYVSSRVIPYLTWLIRHYDLELENAEKQDALNEPGEALCWQVIIESRKEMIPNVQRVYDLFEDAEMSIVQETHREAGLDL